MPFWNRRQLDHDGGGTALLVPSRPASPSEPVDQQLDATLETLAAVLRTLGRHGLEIGQPDPLALAQQYEGWASHVLVATPPPGEEAPRAERGGRRDWGGVRRFVREQRLHEQQAVGTAVHDLREVIWAAVDTLQHALSAEQETDGQVRDRMGHLRDVVERRPPEEIKREVLSAVTVLSQLMEQRQQRQQVYVRELGARISALGSQLQEARRESAVDPLTQLYNRRAFDEYLAKIVGLYDLFGQPAVLLMIDADYFKQLNDDHGHPVGDRVLQALADCLVRTFLRKVDLVARYGGEEFAVVLPDTDLKNGRALAERALDAVRALRVEAGVATLSVTVSIGIAAIRRFDTAADWLQSADRALYAAKQAGRNQIAEG
ncbi:MAG TPA: GGDEF domain-containing protein [Chloroflexota bacterium]|nr:GGDEF domain-containing protein [Chloroflexota bacterium]